MIVKPVVEGLKKPSGVKRPSAITSRLPQKRGRRETVAKTELYTQKATRGLQPLSVGGENTINALKQESLPL